MTPSPPAEVDLADVPLPHHDGGSSKHDRGTVAVLAGSPSTPGAALLAGLAALRVGAGRLRIGTSPEVVASLGVAVPEAPPSTPLPTSTRADPGASRSGLHIARLNRAI